MILRGALSAVAIISSILVGGCDTATSGGSSARRPILPEGSPRPNIVFVLIDTLRADRLGAFGHRGGLTITMDNLAAEGVVFEHCQSAAPWTLPSMASLFTSYYPSVHKVTDYKTAEKHRSDADEAEVSLFTDDFDTLAELLAGSGYETAGISLNPFVQARFGFAQGFRYFQDGVRENGVAGTEANKAAFEWLDQKRDPKLPFFLYVHYMDCHGPYDAPARYVDPLMEAVEKNPNKTPLSPQQRRYLPDYPVKHYLRKQPPVGSDPTRYDRLQGYQEYWIAGYEAGVHEQDDNLAAFFDGLRERNLWDSALVVLVADHGEAFGEHDYFDHGAGLHQHQLSVPLIIRWPGVVPKARRVSGFVLTTDVMPTLLEMVRIPFANVQGRSLVPAIAAGKAEAAPLFSEAAKSAGMAQQAIVSGIWKLIRYEMPPDDPQAQIVYQLFDLSSDPGERTDLSAQKRAITQELAARLDEQRKINAAAKPGHVAKLTPVSKAERAKFGGLGYGESGKGEQPESTSKPSSQPPP